ncbi:hypothetical protein Tdes44962_MAKER09592 [Teratosphaeria destructans]|uniref:Thyroglobulin type-1 domain-containing protein n=1 Tax=Teratosphaeria destructans TaxID=418781 RepID=A0A9W7ST42_9PEZI|nr:hypothetical protein Tdes44962_MAKER09592 [Teratosphaeria destructans]
MHGSLPSYLLLLALSSLPSRVLGDACKDTEDGFQVRNRHAPPAPTNLADEPFANSRPQRCSPLKSSLTQNQQFCQDRVWKKEMDCAADGSECWCLTYKQKGSDTEEVGCRVSGDQNAMCGKVAITS